MEIHFRSKIHEYLYPVHGVGCNLNVIANHTGYIYSSDEDRRKRYPRNVSLLRDGYQKQTITFLSKYYQADAIKKYPQLLPESGQRALKFMDEIEMGEEEWQKEN